MRTRKKDIIKEVTRDIEAIEQKISVLEKKKEVLSELLNMVIAKLN